MRLNNGGWKPVSTFYKMPWENTLYMGLELELENTDRRDEDINKLEKYLIDNKHLNNFYLKTDSSLSSYGVEIVSHPFTYQYGAKELKVSRLVDYLSKNTGFFPAERTGIHVHLSKAFFTNYELRKLRAFFKFNFTPYLQKFSQRLSPGRFGKSSDNLSLKEFILADVQTINAIGRDNCLAIYSRQDQTVEIRLFASTLESKRIVAILQFCEAVAYFIKDYSLSLMLKNPQCWNEFLDWCYKQGRYTQFLKNYFEIMENKYVEPKYNNMAS